MDGSGSASTLRVLVVDDEPAVGRAIQRLLGGICHVRYVGRALDALYLLEQEPDFHLVLCDLSMPELSGPDFFDRLRRQQPRVAQRVAFMSGDLSAEQTFLSSVPNARFAKPFDPEALGALVSNVAVDALRRERATG